MEIVTQSRSLDSNETHVRQAPVSCFPTYMVWNILDSSREIRSVRSAWWDLADNPSRLDSVRILVATEVVPMPTSFSRLLGENSDRGTNGVEDADASR